MFFCFYHGPLSGKHEPQDHRGKPAVTALVYAITGEKKEKKKKPKASKEEEEEEEEGDGMEAELELLRKFSFLAEPAVVGKVDKLLGGSEAAKPKAKAKAKAKAKDLSGLEAAEAAAADIFNS